MQIFFYKIFLCVILVLHNFGHAHPEILVKRTNNGCVVSLWVLSSMNPETFRRHIEMQAKHIRKSNPISSKLMVAAAQNKMEDVVRLIKNDVDINETNRFGCSALIWALGFSSIEIVDLLLRNGADPEIADAVGRTPLMIAARSGEIAKVELLLKYEINKHKLQQRGPAYVGSNALHHAAIKKNNVEMLRLLVAAGVKFDLFDANGERAIDYAVKFNNAENAAYLKTLKLQ